MTVPPCPAVHHRSSAHAAAFVLVSGATTLYSRHIARGVNLSSPSSSAHSGAWGVGFTGNSWGVSCDTAVCTCSGSSSRKFAVFKFNLNL